MSTLWQQTEAALRAGRLDQAAQLGQALVQTEADNGAAWYLLGRIAARRGRWPEAARHLEQALRLAPDRVDVLATAVEVFRRAGRLPEALAAADNALQRQPEQPAVLNNRGLVLQDLGRWAEAEDHFRRAIARQPSYALAHLNLGKTLLLHDRLAEAITSLQTALRLQPGYPQALAALGQAWRLACRPQQAVECLRAALRGQPDLPAALLNLGNALSDLGQMDEAEASLRRAVTVRPDYVAGWHDLGALYERCERLPEALAAYRQALSLHPEHGPALASLVNAQRRLCDWTDWPANVERLVQRVRADLAADRPCPLWPLASCRLPTTNADRLGIARQFAGRLARRVSAAPLRGSYPPLGKDRLVIGFLAHEFRNAVAGHLMKGLFHRFDRRRFEVLALDYSEPDASDVRRRILAGCDRVIDLRPLSPAEAARRIAAERVHILVDINPYMPGGRPEIAAARPAPVQVSYMYPATTGADFIDYFLTDPVVTPPGHESFFSEKLVYLPPSYLPTDADQPIAPETLGREHWGLPTDGFVFASFNAPDKIDPDVLTAWVRILQAVPGSVLWQKDGGAVVNANLRREAEQRGLDPRRLVFAPSLPSTAEHLARQRCADLFLDTFIHGAHATAVDALWAGLPVLTCPGDTFASRVGASVLTAAGLT
ncbi:MAG: tetratricopeptide repeat protein, partial [Gemmataceae bacterium]|nr:tetratricopeptide repeat protein [Gemmataceae bacterium]